MFPYDIVLSAEDICNLQRETELIQKHVFAGRKVSVFGRRNMGKTSVVESLVIPAFRRKFRQNFVMVMDLMGVHTLEDIEIRTARAFERAFAESFPTRAKFQEMIEVIKGLQPGVSVNQQGEWSLQIAGWQVRNARPSLSVIFTQVKNLQARGLAVLIVIDEFQDVRFVKQAEAILRNELQHLPKDVPVILMGSKRHILSAMFSQPDSPFFNWGEPVEFGEIPYDEYHDYMQIRFAKKKLKIGAAEARHIQDLMRRVPEPINILCSYIFEETPSGTRIDAAIIDRSLGALVHARRSKMEEYLTRFTEREAELLIAFAKLGRVEQPSGKAFLSKVSVSKAGVAKILRQFLDQAIVYESAGAYELADPLLAHHLKSYR